MTLFAYATPAMPGMQTLTNSDGSTFTAELKGDPWFHYVQDSSGKIAVFNSNSGNFEYAYYDANSKKLVPSGVKAGTAAGSYGTISNANLSNAWQNARAAAPALPPQLVTLINSTTVYEVQPAHDGMNKQMYKMQFAISNNSITSMDITRIKPSASATKTNSLQISGLRLLNTSAHPQTPSYWTFIPRAGYLEANYYIFAGTTGSYRLYYTGRWFVNQADALNYYNSI